MSTLPTKPQPRPGILDIQAYIPGESGNPGATKIYKLSSNETPLGASPQAIAAYRAIADKLEFYPDGSARRLREAIAARYGLNADRIICGAGSDEILNLLAQAYLGPGDEAIHSQYGFLVYPIATRARGATPVVAREIDETAGVDAILNCVTDRTRIVFLANPNNPTGTFLPIEEVRRLHAGLRKHILLVLDAAYAEYVRRNDYESGIEMVATFENVVMARTFSKVYGLAALRLGWAYCPAHIADVLNRIRGPFNVSAPAIEAGIAALADNAHLDKALAHNDKWLSWLSEQITALGLRVTPSVGNFLLIHFKDDSGKSAGAADKFLSARGLILRRVGAYGLPNALRLTIGTEEANRLVVDALRDFLKGGA